MWVTSIGDKLKKKKKLIWDVLNISNTDCNGWVRKKNFCFEHTDSMLITYKRKMIGWNDMMEVERIELKNCNMEDLTQNRLKPRDIIHIVETRPT